jgi:glycerol-3-phosphate acyltransferase PlsX
MRIVVDAMGSDHAPGPDVAGAVQAAQETDVEIVLVGPEQVVKEELAKHELEGANIEVVHASEVVGMEEHTLSVKTKKDSSMVVGVQMIRQGQADAFVSAGNSGAVMAAALFNLGRLKGVQRPAITTVYPTVRGHTVLLDVGANTDCRPEYLYQFAIMGQAYAERALGIRNPSIGLLSNGEEEGKGNMLVRDTYAIFEEAPFNFQGNVEGKDLPAGMADVVVTDGFTGNVVAKLSEGLVISLARMIKAELTSGLLPKLAAILMLPGLILALPGLLLLWPVLKRVYKRFDPEEIGGAPLLGVRGPVIIAHGRSNDKAIKNAIRAAKRAVANDVSGAITDGLSQPIPEPSKGAEVA